MNSKDVIFDENLEFNTLINESNNEICIVLSDDLNSSEEELTEKYKSQIARFINDSLKWYEKVVTDIISWAKDEYKTDAQKSDIELKNVFILYEQDEQELYGLQFRVAFDVEHGCGIKINTKDFEIVEIGDGDVAFC
jgi:hypothetical protein